MNILRWVLALALAGFFIFMGAQKFGAENVIFATIAERSGMSIFEPGMRMATGVAEIVAAMLLISPKLRVQGARIGLLILIGALGFHLSPWLGISIEGMGNSVFIMALGGLALTLAVFFIERKALREK
ncbi:MAG TPA: hypothetical protein ENJ46_03800 [Hellea balneolensis]|uniref:DoxX family protein n=1 Tax=Hellea balneolensis TaxID=287478 RepID=A0A7C3C9H1_9PROT|nr:hypothetical protein [Hellea balneolensis]